MQTDTKLEAETLTLEAYCKGERDDPLRSEEVLVRNKRTSQATCKVYEKSKVISKYVTVFSMGMIVGDLGCEIAKEIVSKITVAAFPVPIAFALVTFALFSVPLSFYSIGVFDCCCKDQLKEYLDFGCCSNQLLELSEIKQSS